MGFVPKDENDMSVPLMASCAAEMALGRGLCKKEEVRTKAAQNSLISEFRASYARSVCFFKKTVPITFSSRNDSSPAPTHFLRLSLKTS